MRRMQASRGRVSAGLLRNAAGAAPAQGRRGVAAVLAMMFLIIFGSLTAAMAIASRGNIRTASTNLHVMRAQAAAETGMDIAAKRLLDASNRMQVANSDITADYMSRLWSPGYANNGGFESTTDRVLTGVFGPVRDTASAPTSEEMNIAETLAASFNLMDSSARLTSSDYHLAINSATLRNRDNYVTTDSGRYRSSDWVQTPLIKLENASGGSPARFRGTAYSVLYIPLAPRAVTGDEAAQLGNEVRVVVTGYDFSRVNRERAAGNTFVSEPIKRTVVQDFRLGKKLDQAIVSPSRIMLGKNVQIEGNLGVLYGQQLVGQVRNAADNAPFQYADPLVMKSDFYGLDTDLDRRLSAFYTALQGYATSSGQVNPNVPTGDDDNRIRVDAASNTESLALAQENYEQAGGSETGGFADVTGDGFIDEFDIFIKKYDTTGPSGNPDGRVSTAEFTRDPLLFDLIDSTNPDRNRDGVWGFVDLNNNGIRDDAGGTLEPFLDTVSGFSADNNLGYLDGYIDRKDRYVKVQGKLMYRVARNDWNSALGERTNEGLPSQNQLRNTNNRVQGAIRAREGEVPQTFSLSETLVPDVQASNIVSSNSQLMTGSFSSVTNFYATLQAPAANQVPIGGVVASMNQGSLVDDIDAADGAQWDGLPNTSPTADPLASTGAYYERMPYDSKSFYDWYYRPVYRNMVFRNATIPMGLNALFINCWFIGVTRVQSYEGNLPGNTSGSLGTAARLWNEYGKMTRTGNNAPVLVNPRTRYQTLCTGYSWATEFPELNTLSSGALPAAGPDVMMAVPPLDRGDVPVSARLNGGGPGSCGQPVQGWENLVSPLVIPSSVTNAVVVGITGVEANGTPLTVNLAGKRVVSTKWLSNNLRFHNCLFVGTVVSSNPQQYSSARNKIQFTGATRMVNTPDRIPSSSALRPYIDTNWGSPSEEYLNNVKRSTLMLPNFSVDIGSFTTASPALSDGIVELRGATIAGVLDVRGNASIEGSLLLTFNPIHGTAPMQNMAGAAIGNPALFNTTLGYFGAEQGDQEAVDPNQLPTAANGRLIAGWDLNGDGIPDTYPSGINDPGPGGAAVPIYFNYGRINVKFNPDIGLPNGLRLPLSFTPLSATYREDRLAN
jgi:hypothetical protein